MEVCNGKTVPYTLIEIARCYDVDKLICFSRTPKSELNRLERESSGGSLPNGCFGVENGKRVIRLYLSKIFSVALIHGPGIDSFGMWHRLLSTLLHEIGHIMQDKTDRFPDLGYTRRYLEDKEFHRLVEADADRFKRCELGRLAELSDRLFQPGSLGYLGVLLNRKRQWAYSNFGRRYSSGEVALIQDIRGRRIGGQYTLTQAIRECVGYYYTSPSYSKVNSQTRQQFKKWLQLYGMGRTVQDSSGRRHIYLTYGEVMQIKNLPCALKRREEPNDLEREFTVWAEDDDIPF